MSDFLQYKNIDSYHILFPVIIPGSGVCKDCPAGKTCTSDDGSGIAATSPCPVGKFCLAATVSVCCPVQAICSLFS